MPERHSSKAQYRHYRQRSPNDFIPGKDGKPPKFETVPISHTNYRGKKFAKKGIKAITGRIKPHLRKRTRDGRSWQIQSILVPKNMKL